MTEPVPEAVGAAVSARATGDEARWGRALRWGFTPALAAAGFVLAWVASSPRWLAFINWDQGHYVGLYATGRLGWSAAPWNAHFAIGHLYNLGGALARLWGGTPIDGFRLTNAVFFGAACAVVGDASRRVTGRRWLAALLAAVWATSFVTLFLLLTLEDNVLYLPFAAGVMWVCVVRTESWRARDSVVVGALAGLAALQSWQALVYLGPAVWAAILAGPGGRRIGRRALEAAAVLGSFVATLLLWCVGIGLTSKLGVGFLLGSMFSRPTGSFVLRPLGDARGALEAIGAATSYLLAHDFGFAPSPPALPLSRVVLGGIVVAVALAALVVATVAAWRRRRAGAHVVAAALAAFVLVTPIYKDVGFRYLIRFDFLPLLAVLLGAYGAAWVCARWRRAAIPVGLALAALLVGQTVLAAQWDLRRHAWYPTLAVWPEQAPPEPTWYGRDGKTWYWYFRDLRRANPGACRYLLHSSQIVTGSWNTELMGSLLSELPTHVVIGDPSQVKKWRLPPHVVTLAEARRLAAEPCTWVSPDARRALDGQ